MSTFENTLDFALQLDMSDPLNGFRNKFLVPKKEEEEKIYLLGNSLGLQPRQTRNYIDTILQQWHEEGVESFFSAHEPWLKFHDKLVGSLSIITGALPHEISVMNQLTVNIHLMLAGFYQPKGKRNKILVEPKAFPSDQYALKSYIKHIGLDPDEVIVHIESQDGSPVFSNEQVLNTIEKHKDELALVFLSGVQYYSGQLFDMKSITHAAHEIGALVGFDLAHAVGNVELHLHDWEVDFACWCSYKYLNGGPGAVGGVFVHEKHHNKGISKLEGWWGVKESERFLMKDDFIASPDATSWQLSTPPVLLYACLLSSLDVFALAGWKNVLQKQQKMIAWTDFLLNEVEQDVFQRITPSHRGCQLSLQFKNNGKHVFEQLVKSGFMVDWREPDVIRFAPVPLYNSYAEIWYFIQKMKEVVKEVSLSN